MNPWRLASNSWNVVFTILLVFGIHSFRSQICHLFVSNVYFEWPSHLLTNFLFMFVFFSYFYSHWSVYWSEDIYETHVMLTLPLILWSFCSFLIFKCTFIGGILCITQSCFILFHRFLNKTYITYNRVFF